MEKRVNKKQIFSGLFLLFFLGIICVVTYKAQIRKNLNQPIEYTMMTEHKETSEVVLSGEGPEFSEVFLCSVPELKSLSIELTGKNVIDAASLNITLSDAETGKIYYQERRSVRAVMDSRVQNKAEFALENPLRESKGKELCLTWNLENAGSTSVHLTANQKQAIVLSFNGIDGNGTNVIYSLSYGDGNCLRILYVFLCIGLLAFAAWCWWIFIVRRTKVERFFFPMALFLGVIFQCLVTVGGVPDEPGHLDTAYKYSNKILFVEETETPGTIYKRACDVEMSDMLANGLESNSYYQLMTETFTRPDNTELMEVSYVDSTNLAPGIVYVPSAVGLSLGRLLGLSAMLTFQIARICNLLCFVILAWAAVRLIPFGKNLLGMTAILPITLQQGASFSYDAMVNGLLLLFSAFCFRLWKKEQKEKWEIVLTAFLALFTALAKGGVYLPLLMLLIPAFLKGRDFKNTERKKIFLWIGLAAAAAAFLAAVAVLKFMPVFQTFLEGNGQNGDSTYTISYLIQHPLNVVYLYWNTVMQEGDTLLQGLLGGILSWLDLRMNWIFQLIFLFGLILTANLEKDRFEGKFWKKVLIMISCSISAAFIMMSMLVGYTKASSDYIQGLQGRYFLPLALPLFFLGTTQMVRVQRKQSSCIWMTVMVTEVLLILQIAAVLG